jgi:solute:Na+ symporter, SSS family
MPPITDESPGTRTSPELLYLLHGDPAELQEATAGMRAADLADALRALTPEAGAKVMAARATHPGITDPNIVLPTLLVEQLPAALGAFALAAVFSAEVNTCDALLFMLSTSLSQDLYKRFLRPNASDAQLLRMARLSAALGGVGGVLFALRLATIIDALKIFYTLLGVTLLVPVVGGLYVRRARSADALASMAAGIGTVLVVRFAIAAQHPWVDPTAAGLIAAAVAFALSLLVRVRAESARPASRPRRG